MIFKELVDERSKKDYNTGVLQNSNISSTNTSEENERKAFDDFIKKSRERYDKANEAQIVPEDSFTINTWFKDASTAMNNLNTLFKDRTYKSMSDREKTVGLQVDDLISKGKYYRDTYKQYLGTESEGASIYNALDSYVYALEKYKMGAKTDTNITNEYGSEDAYNRAVKIANEQTQEQKRNEEYAKKYNNPQSYDDFVNILNNSQDEDEKNWARSNVASVATSEQLKNLQEHIYDDYNNYIANGGAVDAKWIQELDKKYDEYGLLIEEKKYEEKKKTEYDDVIENDVKLKETMQNYYNLQKYDNQQKLGGAVEEMLFSLTSQGVGTAKHKSSIDAYNYAKDLTPEERKQIIANFNSIKNKDTLYKYYKREREEQEAVEENQLLSNYSEEHPILGSLESMSLNTYGSVGDAVKYAGAGIDKAFGGDGYINPASTNVAKAQVIREKVSEDMNGAGKFLYNTAMGIGDNIARMPLLALPGGEALTLALAGTSAGTAAANNVINSGGNIENALLTGVAAGAAEVLLEKIPLEKLIKLKNEGTDSVIKAISQQVVTEGLEEVGTDIVNALTDHIINGDMAQLSQKYNAYIEQGFSENEAWKNTAGDFALEIAQDFGAGAISGGVLSGGTIGLNYAPNKIKNSVANNKVGKAVKEKENVTSLIETAKNLSSDSKAHKVALQLEKQQKNNKKISSSKVGQLRSLIIEQSKSEFDTEYNKVTKNLHEDEKAVVDKLLNGEALSGDEVKIINDNDVLKNSISDLQKKFNNLYYNAEKADKSPFQSIKSIDDDTDKIDDTKLNISENGKTEINDEVYDGAMKIVRTNPFDKTVTYKIEKNGEAVEVNSKNIKFETKEEAKLNALASKYNVQTAQKFFDLYESGQDVDEYSREFNIYQNYGRLAVPLDDNKLNLGYQLNNNQKKLAYEAGLTSRKSYYQEQNILSSNAKNSKYYAYTKGNFDASAIEGIQLDETQREFYNFFREFALRTGINVELFSSKMVEGEYKSEQGSWNRNTKTIRVDINAGLMRASDRQKIKHGMLNTFSHELTHIAEVSGFYDELHSAIVSALEKRGISFNELVEKKKEQLRNNLKAKPIGDEELTYLADVEVIADSCETMLKNSKIFEDIAQGNPGLAQKLKDKLKNFIARLKQLLSKTNALTHEGKLLEACVTEFEDIQKLWDKAVTDGIKTVNAIHAEQKNNTAENGDVKNQSRSNENEFDISDKDIEVLRTIGKKSINDFNSEDIQKSEKWARKFYKELGTKSPFFRAWFGDWRGYDVNPAIATPIIQKTDTNIKNHKIKNNDTKWYIHITNDVVGDSLHYASKNEKIKLKQLFANIDNVIENAILLDTAVSQKNSENKKGSTQFMHYMYSLVEYNGNPFLAKITIEEYGNETSRRAYNVERIKMSALSRREYDEMKKHNPFKRKQNADAISILDLFSLVKQYDKKFNPKPVNPVMLNDDGTPKVFYHSTNENFTVFKKGERAGLSGKGIYFSPYSQNLYGRNLMPVYLKIENPMTKANEPDGAREINSAGFKTKIIPDFFEKFPEYDAIIQRDEVVVKSPNQIKSATDNIGTFDGNNPDIQYQARNSKPDYNIEYQQRYVEPASTALEERLQGDELLDAQDIIDTIKSVGGKVDEYGNAILYHSTNKKSRDSIYKSGKMFAKEDGLFFSTKPDGEIKGYGDNIVRTKIPVEYLELNDIFNDEVHFRIPLDSDYSADVSSVLFQMRPDNGFTNRRMLANALENSVQDNYEKKLLNLYKDNIDQIDELEARLDEVNQKIKKATSVKAADRNREQRTELVKLNNVKKILEDKITRKDKQLLNLESMKPMQKLVETEKKKAYHKARISYEVQLKEVREKRDQALLAEREKRIAQLKEVREKANNKIANKIAEEKQKAIEKRKKETEIRNTRDVIEKLKKLIKKMTSISVHPTDKAYVPANVANEYNNLLTALVDALNFENGSKVSFALSDLSSYLRNLNAGTYNSDFESTIDKDLIESIDKLKDAISDKKIQRKNSKNNGLTLQEATDIYNACHDVYWAIRDATKQLEREDYISTRECGEAAIDEINNISEGFLTNTAIGKLYNGFCSAYVTARYFSGYNDDSELMYHTNALGNGVKKEAGYFMGAKKPFNELTENPKNVKKLKSFINDAKEIEYIDNARTKKTVVITEDIAVQILMSWNREMNNDNLIHMQTGGIVIPNVKLLIKGKIKQAFEKTTVIRGINQSFINSVSSIVTDFGKQYMNIAEWYYNEYSKLKINEVSNILKHRDIATENHYIPFSVDSNFLITDIEALKYDSTLENMGMFKTVVKKDAKPIVMTGITSVTSKHIKDTARFYGFAVATRNFQKVLNVKVTKENEKGIKVPVASVKRALETKYGKSAYEFFTQLIADANTGRRTPDNYKLFDEITSKLMGAVSKKIFAFNLSPTIKSTASYNLASAEISQASLSKNFIKNSAKMLNPKVYEEVINEIDAHTPMHFIRREGLALNEIRLLSEELQSRLPKAIDGAKWLQLADCYTTALLWGASKEEINTKYRNEGKGNEIGSSSYFKEVTETYERVLSKTQQNYDFLSRPEIQKTSNQTWRMLAMYKSDAFTNASLLYESIGNAIVNKDSNSYKKIAKVASAQLISLLDLALKGFAMAIIYGRIGRYDDDEDKDITFQSVAKGIGYDMLSNYSGIAVPAFGSEILDIVTEYISGNTYDIDSFDSPILSSLTDSIAQLFSAIENITTSIEKASLGYGFDVRNIVETTFFAASDFAGYFGVPAENILNIFNSAFEWIQGENPYFGNSPVGSIKSYATLVKKGDMNGAKEKINKLFQNEYDKQIENGLSSSDAKKKAKATIRNKFTYTYKTEYQKAFLRNDIDKMKEISTILSSSGYMKWENKTLSTVLSDWRKSAKEDVEKTFD